MMNSYLLLQLKDLYKRYDKSDYGDRRPDEGSLINKRCPCVFIKQVSLPDRQEICRISGKHSISSKTPCPRNHNHTASRNHNRISSHNRSRNYACVNLYRWH